jgi:hypothetical protein
MWPASEIIKADSTNDHMTTRPMDESTLPGLGSPERRRLAMWLVVSVFVALLVYFGFRGYLNPELLFHFANSLIC